MAHFRVRFHFISDYSNTDPGWYIDDVSLIGEPVPTGAPGSDPIAASASAARATLRVVPNPARGTAGIILRLPEGARGRCEVFGASGRRIAVLAEGRLSAGERSLRWDGRDSAGHAVAAGIYWAAWTGPGVAVRVPIVLLK